MEVLNWKCIEFDKLSSKQLYQIIQLREKVFVVEQDCPYLDSDGKDIHAKHLMGYKGNLLVAYARLIPAGISYKNDASIGRFVTDISLRRTGVGKVLMEKSLAQLKADYPEYNIRISAQEYLKDFYGNFGFIQQGSGYLEDDIPHIEMLLERVKK